MSANKRLLFICRATSHKVAKIQIVSMPPPKTLMGSSANVASNVQHETGVHYNDDSMAMVLGYLCLEEIMKVRSVCKQWRQSATMTIVPNTNFDVDSVDKYKAMTVMAEWLPNLQQITLQSLGNGHKYGNGVDPIQDKDMLAENTNHVIHNIGIVSNFKRLRILEVLGAQLNGRYLVLFDFSLLQKLVISGCSHAKFDLEMLSRTPLLKELRIDHRTSSFITGNIGSLRVLKGTLERVAMNCGISGRLMDLADFPHLIELMLGRTVVTGDVRDIGECDFIKLEQVILPVTVYGGRGYQFLSVDEVSNFMIGNYQLVKEHPALFLDNVWCLAEDSPDYYWFHALGAPYPPFQFQIARVGSRMGWRWHDGEGNTCDMNWLDPEPRDVAMDITSTTKPNRVRIRVADIYKGYYQPPAEDEYLLLRLFLHDESSRK